GGCGAPAARSVRPFFLVKGGEACPARVPRTGIEHEVVEVQGIAGPGESRSAEESDRNLQVLRGLPRGRGEVRRRISGDVPPGSKASRGRKDDVGEGRCASSRALACMVRRDVPKASETAVA